MTVYISRDVSDAELTHYGVMGMKWGVRHDKENSKDYKKSVKNVSKEVRKRYRDLERLHGSNIAGAFGRSMLNEAANSRKPYFIEGVDKGLRSVNRRANVRASIGTSAAGGGIGLLVAAKVLGASAATAAAGLPLTAAGVGTIALGSAITRDVFGKMATRAKTNRYRKQATKKLKAKFINEGSSIDNMSYNKIGVLSGRERYKRV